MKTNNQKETLLFTTCGYSKDYYCLNHKKCEHKTRLYTDPNYNGKSVKTKYNVCMQFILLYGV